MTATPIDRIASMLGSAGYRRVTTPLNISGLNFDFPMVFVGTNPSPDLILVADTAFDSEQRILKRLEGVARALDVAGSKRPLTAVLAGPRPNSGVLDAMSRVCRVLPVGSTPDADSEVGLKNWLAVLLPLQLPTPSGSIADPLTEIAQHLDGLKPEMAELVNRAEDGADAVQACLYELIAEPIAKIEAEITQ